MYQPIHMDLHAATQLVRRRLGLKAGERDQIEDAIREGALSVSERRATEILSRDPGWFVAANIWRPNPYQHTNPRPGQVSIYHIMVKSADVDRLWPEPPPAAASADAAKPRDKGGRPRIYDWEAAILELVRHTENDPHVDDSQAALTAHLLGWFSRQSTGEPARSEAEKRVRAFRRARSGET